MPVRVAGYGAPERHTAFVRLEIASRSTCATSSMIPNCEVVRLG